MSASVETRSHNKTHLAAGLALVLSLFGLTWKASSLLFALLLWAWLIALALLVLYLLKRNTKPAKVGAVVLQWNTIFLFFLPRHIREGIEELRNRENKQS